MTTSITFISILIYLFAGFLLLRRMQAGISASRQDTYKALALGAAAACLHAGLLYFSLHMEQGLNLSLFNMLSVVGWVVAVMLIASAWSRPVENLGVVALPVAALTLLLQEALSSKTVNLVQVSPALEVHILLSILSYSLLTLAVVQALMLAVQDYQLRHRHPGGFIRALPPLQTMESLLFQMIGTGYVLLTLSLLTGVTFIENIFAQHLVHKTVLSFLSWGVFAVLLWGRWKFGWRGRTAIRWTLSGFLVLMLAYFGSKMVLELILAR